MDGDARANPYLAGNFAPVRTEDDFDLEVTGRLPACLRGTLYRNGPNPQFPPRDAAHHWFLGDGMVHAFAFTDGQVTYRNRFVRTPKWCAEHDAGRALFGSWGNPLTSDPAVLGTDGGVANTNIVAHAGRLLALEEAHAPFELAPRTLAPRGYADVGGRMTAHPKLDPRTGQMVFFAYADADLPLSPRVSWGMADQAGRLVGRETFEAPYCSMIHDFMVTQRHVLIPVLPLSGSLQRAMQGGPVFAWDPSLPARVAVLRRDQGIASLRWFETDPCYVFHFMNAWEQGGRVIAHAMHYARAPLFPDPDGTPHANAPAVLTQWVFDLTGESDRIEVTPLDDLAGEFPRVDPRVETLANRHGWFAAVTPQATGTAVAHIDLRQGRRTAWAVPEGDAVSEPVFVPARADAPEGEGVLLAVVYRAADYVSDLVVLDAQNVAAGPLCTARVPRRVPFGFHGNWVPG